MTPKLKCLTLYAGAGGADLGLLAAGVEHVACVDANADCVATLRAAGASTHGLPQRHVLRAAVTLFASDPLPWAPADADDSDARVAHDDADPFHDLPW
jgi:site-specific DNA-cytosine methylase